jgi:hypothetical protein
MTRHLPFLLLLCACGESNHANRSPLADELFIPPECGDEPLAPRVDDDGLFYGQETVGYPFFAAFRSQDEHSSATLSVPQAGTICLRGTLAAFAASQFPYAELALFLEEYSLDGKCRWPLVDARAFGATSLRFSLDEVPDTHLFLTAATFQRAECPESPYGCVVGGTYTLRTHDREDLLLLQPGVNLALFEDFVGDELSVPLDTSRLSIFTLRLAPTNRALDFGFCLSDLAFLDAAGHEVAPRPRSP